MNYAVFEFLDEILKAQKVLLGILGGGMRTQFPNRDPILDQRNVIFHTGFIPGLLNPYLFSNLA